MKRSLVAASLLVVGIVGCRKENESRTHTPTHKVITRADNLASARKRFVTKLLVRGPAPEHYHDDDPPTGATQVYYTSVSLKLKGWLSACGADNQKRPAVVYLHPDWALEGRVWKEAEAFVKAGFVLFIPMLRGENGNPGIYESFLGEAEDAIAAGRFVSSLPNVDGQNIFVAGHSVGGVLTCLVSMLPSPYKAAAAFGGCVDMEAWVAEAPEAFIPYDRTVAEEVMVRNPMAFVASIRCPLRLYAGSDDREVNAALAAKARLAEKDCELVVVEGNHATMVTPAIQQAIAWFRKLATK